MYLKSIIFSPIYTFDLFKYNIYNYIIYDNKYL